MKLVAVIFFSLCLSWNLVQNAEKEERMLAENVSNQRFMACFGLFYFLQQSHRNQKMSGTTAHSIYNSIIT